MDPKTVSGQGGDYFIGLQLIDKITMIGGWNNAGEFYTEANAGDLDTGLRFT
jgi:hypothetical protein